MKIQLQKNSAGKLEELPKLNAADHYAYRSSAGSALYLSGDREDLAYASKEAMRDASRPTEISQRRTKRIGRYLLSHRRLIHHYRWCRPVKKARCFVDSDHAGCEKTRKSTSGGALMMGMCLLAFWSVTQPVPSLSSGESEFYACVKGAHELLGLKHLVAPMLPGGKLELELLSDSSAARAMLRRLGTNARTKHIATQYLWIQHFIRSGAIGLSTVLTTENPADIGTKAVDAVTLEHLIPLLGLSFAE